VVQEYTARATVGAVPPPSKESSGGDEGRERQRAGGQSRRVGVHPQPGSVAKPVQPEAGVQAAYARSLDYVGLSCCACRIGIMRLDVVVRTGCWGCDEARGLAQAIAAGFPELDVLVVELGGDDGAAEVVATPTYLLAGRVISLGNPSVDQVERVIRSAAPR